MSCMKTLLKPAWLRCLGALLAGLLLVSGCRKAAPPEEAAEPPAWPGFAVLNGLLLDDELALDPDLKEAPVYRLALSIDDSLTELSGRLSILYSNREARSLERLSFFLFPNLVGGLLEVTDLSAAGEALSPRYSRHKSWLHVDLPRPLAPGERIELDLSYNLTVPQDSREGYGGCSYSEGVLSLAHAYPTLPAVPDEERGLPPEFGDFLYNRVAFYRVRASLPADAVLAFPGLELASREQHGRRSVDFVLGPARDLYLAAGRGLEARGLEAGPVRITHYGRRGERAAAGAALETARFALESFGRRFGPYPYSTLAMVSVPIAAFGIEYPGIIVNSSRMYDPSWSYQGIPAAALLESTTAHEVAHQWFYGLVGSDQRGEPWLDEAPAQYATWLYYLDRYGAGGAGGFFASFSQRWNRVAGRPIPIGMPVDAYSETEYGAIVYGRGPLFLAALEERLGQESFARFLAAYGERFRWRIADGAGFQSLAEEVGGRPLGDLFAAWVQP
jgi:hypothetical protein